MVNSPNVALNLGGANFFFRRNNPFEIVSIYLTGAWNNGLEVTVTGLRKGLQVDRTTFTVQRDGSDAGNPDHERLQLRRGCRHGGRERRHDDMASMIA